MSTADNTKKIPILVQFYTDHWGGHVRCILAHAKKVNALHETEAHVLEETALQSLWGIFKPPYYDPASELRKQARSIIDRMALAASSEFAPSGGTLAIDRAAYVDRFLPDGDAWAFFDPAAVWDAICRDYGGGKGAGMAYAQAASRVINLFSINPGQPPEIKSGAVILNLPVFLDATDKQLGLGNRLHPRCVGTVANALSSIGCFLAWAGIDEAAGAIRQALDKIGRDRQVTSRELIKIANGVSCITYQSRFEFRLHGDLGVGLGYS
jgi:hypothetical protein